MKPSSGLFNLNFLDRWTWIVGILFLFSLILPPSVQLPANSSFLAFATLLVVVRGFAACRSGALGIVERAGLTLSGLIIGWVLLNLALHRFQSNRPLEWLALVTGLILFWTARFAFGPTSGRYPLLYLWMLAILAVVEGLLGIVQIFWPSCVTPGLHGASFPRASGTFSNPNQYAGFMAAALPVVFSLAISTGRKLATRIGIGILSALGAAVVFAGLVASASRGALIGLFSSLLIACLLAAWARRRILLLFPLGLLLLALILGVAATAWSYRSKHDSAASMENGTANPLDPNDRRSFLHTLLALGTDGRALKDPTVHDRLAAAAACLHLWQDHPWLGVGPGNFTRFAPQYLHETRDPVFFDTGAHNLPFQWLAELGVVGGLFWPTAASVMAVVLYRRFRRAPRGSRNAQAAFLLGWAFMAVWVHNLVDITILYHPLKYILPFIAALAVSWPPFVENPQADAPQSRGGAE